MSEVEHRRFTAAQKIESLLKAEQRGVAIRDERATRIAAARMNRKTINQQRLKRAA